MTLLSALVAKGLVTIVPHLKVPMGTATKIFIKIKKFKRCVGHLIDKDLKLITILSISRKIYKYMAIIILQWKPLLLINRIQFFQMDS